MGSSRERRAARVTKAKSRMGTVQALICMIFVIAGMILWISFGNDNISVATDKANSLIRHRHIEPVETDETTKVFESSLTATSSPLDSETVDKKPVARDLHAPGLDPPNSKYAYVTLIHGIDESFKYRGYLYNVMIMKTALASYGSTADFIVLLGFTQDGDRTPFQSDIDKLKEIGIRIYYLPRLVDTPKVHFGEMALLKVTPWSFTQYEKVQFFDGDIMPKSNMDCYFELEQNTFNVGNASPLNSGWYLAITNIQDYENLKAMAVKRLTERWDEVKGWGGVPPAEWLHNARGKHIFAKWTFNGASLDQGLLTHYFVVNNGRVMLINGPNSAKKYSGEGRDGKSISYAKFCNGKPPTSVFAHFTGKSKPWLNDIRTARRGSPLETWGKFLDGLRLPNVNTSNIHTQALKPPLGYFHPNK